MPKNHIFSNCGGRRENFLGYFVWKITILRPKILFFPILGGAAPPPPPWIRPWFLWGDGDVCLLLDQYAWLDFIVPAHWNNSPRLDKSLPSNTLSWCFMLNGVSEYSKYQFHILWFVSNSKILHIWIEFPVEWQWISSVSYGIEDKLDWKGPTNAEFQNLNFLIFHPVFCKMIIFMGYWWTIQKLFQGGIENPKFRIYWRDTEFLFFIEFCF